MTHPAARDERGRVIGTAHDFQGWCSLPPDHPGPHAAPPGALSTACGYPVALVGDVARWQPKGILT